MSYIDELLGRDERIVYIARQHLFVLVSSVLTELLLIAILISAGVASQAAFRNQLIGGTPVGQLVLLICGIISIGIVISAFLDYLRWNNEEFIITDQRVIQLRGILSKRSTDSSLEKINDLELRQSWLGRIFDFGDIRVLTASDLGANTMRWVAHPLDFKRELREAQIHYQRGFGYIDPSVEAYVQAAPVERQRQPDIEQTLQTLASLRDQGILSESEFESKKRELLSRL
ncbi:MAG TPA: PH domain-containing protein [Roseiflexaceae bacterium]|jgi:hypothetical protein|nr:PH domain-containing protein [Roseiflexaceae bacterium]